MKPLAELRSDVAAALERLADAQEALRAAQREADRLAGRVASFLAAESTASDALGVRDLRELRRATEDEHRAALNRVGTAREAVAEAQRIADEARRALQEALRGPQGQEEVEALIIAQAARSAEEARRRALTEADAQAEAEILDRLYARLDKEAGR